MAERVGRLSGYTKRKLTQLKQSICDTYGRLQKEPHSIHYLQSKLASWEYDLGRILTGKVCEDDDEAAD